MGKKGKAGRAALLHKKISSKSKVGSGDGGGQEDAATGSVSRKQQRKVLRKLGFLEKVKNSAAGVRKKVAPKKQSKAAKEAVLSSFAELSAALGEAGSKHGREGNSNTAAAGRLKGAHEPKFRSAAQRSALEACEQKRLSVIWEAPSFKANPINVLTQFLDNTLAPVPVVPTQRDSRSAQKKKKKGAKSAGGDEDMMQT